MFNGHIYFFYNGSEGAEMHIGILSRMARNYSTRRIVEEARARGHTVRVIDPSKCYMNITSSNPKVYIKGKEIKGLDCIVPRIGSSITYYGCAVLRQFQMMGVYTPNQSIAITRSRDKLRALQLLSSKGVGLPVTGFARNPDDADHLSKLMGGAPLVIKLLEGTQGKGVVLTETKKAFESVIDAFSALSVNILVQEFVKEAEGADIRCLVIGDKVVAAMMRKAKEGEFRSNIHQGGTAMPVKLTPKERATAVSASKAVGLTISGVDIMRSSHGPVVLEVNSSPGLEGIESTTKVNVAGLMIEHIERKISSGNQKIRGNE